MAHHIDEDSPMTAHRLRAEEAKTAVADILKSAPPRVFRGRRPTEEEIAASRDHKAKIKAYLDTLPPDMRVLFKTSGLPAVGSKSCSNKERRKEKKTSSKPRVARPTETSGLRSKVSYLCVLDFEATCDDKQPAPRPQEIIEFPTLLLNARTGEVEREFHHYVKPDVHPTLTPFCTELTGIAQGTVDAGVSLDRSLALHREWLDEAGLVPAFAEEAAELARSAEESGTDPPTFLYLTCGDWDLRTCLPRQLDYHSKIVPTVFRDWINVKHEFQSLYGKKAGGMAGMLRELGMELRGRHHSGIDDCRNIARICERMLKDGWVPGGGRSSVSTPPKSGGTEAASGVPAKENVHVGVKGTSRGGWVDEGKVREAVYSALDEADCGGSRRRGRNRS